MLAQQKNKQLSREVRSALRRKALAEQAIPLPPLARSAWRRAGPVQHLDYVRLAADAMRNRRALLQRDSPDTYAHLPLAQRRSKFAPAEPEPGRRGRLQTQLRRDMSIPSIELDPKKAGNLRGLIGVLDESPFRRSDLAAASDIRQLQVERDVVVRKEALGVTDADTAHFEVFPGTAARLQAVLQALAPRTEPTLASAVNKSFDMAQMASPTKLLALAWVRREPRQGVEVNRVCVLDCERTDKGGCKLGLRFLSSGSLAELEVQLRQLIDFCFGDSLPATSELAVSLQHALQSDSQQLAVDPALVAVIKRCGFKWRAINNRLDGSRFTVYSLARRTALQMKNTAIATAIRKPLFRVESSIVLDRSGAQMAQSPGDSQAAAVAFAHSAGDGSAHIPHPASLAAPPRPPPAHRPTLWC